MRASGGWWKVAVRWTAVVVLCAGLAPAVVEPARRAPAARNVGPPDLRAFAHRVRAYTKLAGRAERKQRSKHKGTHVPAKIEARERSLAEVIQAERQHARPGDVFGADLAPWWRDVVRTELTKGPLAASERKVARDEPTAVVTAEVNAVYPLEVPLSTVPAPLLLKLPPLPEGLAYRFVGRALILHDTKANLIVDVVPDCLPAPAPAPSASPSAGPAVRPLAGPGSTAVPPASTRAAKR